MELAWLQLDVLTLFLERHGAISFSLFVLTLFLVAA